MPDRRGRRGLAFARTREGIEEWALVDPVTATLLEERSTVVDKTNAGTELAGFEVGDRVGGSVYLERAIVKSVRQRP